MHVSAAESYISSFLSPPPPPPPPPSPLPPPPPPPPHPHLRSSSLPIPIAVCMEGLCVQHETPPRASRNWTLRRDRLFWRCLADWPRGVCGLRSAEADAGEGTSRDLSAPYEALRECPVVRITQLWVLARRSSLHTASFHASVASLRSLLLWAARTAPASSAFFSG